MLHSGSEKVQFLLTAAKQINQMQLYILHTIVWVTMCLFTNHLLKQFQLFGLKGAYHNKMIMHGKDFKLTVAYLKALYQH